jgi:monoamine oxidase
MARTPLAERLREAVSVVAEANERGVEPERVLEERRSTRRQFIGVAGAAVFGATAFGRLAGVARGGTAPKIAIVGAGLAGLTCAYRLKQAGLVAQVYEAHPTRIGGRCWTIRSFADGQLGEHGGELIDQGHIAMRHLASELGLTLDNLLQGEPGGTEDFYYFDGEAYPATQIATDLNAIYQKLHKDTVAAGYPTTWDSYTKRGFELDHMSIVDWLDETVPNGGANAPLGQLLDVAYNIEYGAESSVQSSLNLLYLLGFSGQGQFRVFGKSNEKYHVRGGNDQVPTILGQQLAGQINPGLVLTSIKRDSDGSSYTLTFANGSGTTTVTADHVVLALPFSLLRKVNYSKAGFEPLKVTAIKELAMGTNSKLHLQFRDRYWYGLGNNGNTYADTGYQNTWEVTRAQPGPKGILVDYTGGKVGASFGSGTPTSRAQEFLAQIEPVLPGIGSHWIQGAATVDFWAGNPWTLGSYSYWKVGQYTKFSGIEGVRQGNCHFCGEHTSQDSQGYLNGAVETGERAADEILGDLK